VLFFGHDFLNNNSFLKVKGIASPTTKRRSPLF